MAELRRDPGLRIGIIGVGRVGHLLATCLLRYADVGPDDLFLVSGSNSDYDRYCFSSII